MYGECSVCGYELSPVWFIEKEEELFNASIFTTGRERKACSHLLCDICGHTECVDSTFDGPWHRKRENFIDGFLK